MAEKSYDQVKAQSHKDRRTEFVWLTGAALTGLLATSGDLIQQMTVLKIVTLATVYARNALAQIDCEEKEGI